MASIEELNKQGSLDSLKSRYVVRCKAMIGELNLPMKLVEVEPILGEELLTFYFMAQERVVPVPIGPDGARLLPGQTGATNADGTRQLQGPSADVMSSDQTHLETAKGNRSALESQIDINAVEGAVRASSLKRIGEIVEQHPQETVQLVRQWMGESAP